MNVNILFLDGTNHKFKSSKVSELDSVDDAIRDARDIGNDAPVLFYELEPSDLKSVVRSHA